MRFSAGLAAEKYDRQYSDRELIRRIAPYFRAQWKRLAGLVTLVLLISATSSLLPILVSRGVDRIEGRASWELALTLGGAVAGIGIVRWVANWARRRLAARAVSDVILNLAKDAFEASTAHDLSFHDEHSSGKILSRITTDTRDFGQLINMTVDVTSQVAEAVILGVVLVRIEWRLSLYIFALVPILFFLTVMYRRFMRRVTRQGMRAMAEVNATIKETVSGIAVAKNFRQEQNIYNLFERANSTSYRMNVRRGLAWTVVIPTLNGVGGLASAILVYFGGMNVIQGVVTAGAWYLFLLSLDSFFFPVMSMASFMTQIQTGLAAAERVFALIDAAPVVKQTGSEAVGRLRGAVDFVHVNFRYKDAEPVLDDFSVSIRPGENLALVGHTGAGKSSVARLVARFYEFQEGEIRIDGRDIRSLDLEAYRRQLGIVSQTPFLFSGTVLDNIRYARPEASDAEIEEISRQVGEGEWIETLPRGLDSEVGERGAFLSMGQRQIVSLIRVLVQKPTIFILDEATASVDPFTEWQIQQALNLILSSTTSFLIAHRLSTVKSADRILVMRSGKIIETGSHQDLLAQGGHYAELYNTYFRHQSLAYVEQARQIASGSGV
ncbi:ABC transporter ATP-binding protein [Levilinea saccharolytica]|uniref:ABC transporter n=1 Tax=Levilinea saccharolytica TaxID=229921 RepID=A0A0P6XW35_9CHLR|nr:ABC transporter ATP-binding protein [Levilinea saccharolytica]KPL83487.1 ABC transporter [Levilinea saccharolytica]GAP18272.1 ABC-type multidrug transport system, ATPase and permease components [Levilinea saccharolytica]